MELPGMEGKQEVWKHVLYYTYQTFKMSLELQVVWTGHLGIEGKVECKAERGRRNSTFEESSSLSTESVNRAEKQIHSVR